MKKIMVIGGSHSDVPIIKAAVAHGMQTITTGNRPDHPGHLWSHRYVEGDYSRPREMVEIAKREAVDWVVPGANDFAMVSAASVAQELGLGGFDDLETTLVLHEKDRFKRVAERIGLPVCRSQSVDTPAPATLQLRPPYIVKPVDLTGGKGITRIDSSVGLNSALQHARQLSRKTTVIVEEFFEGSLHSYSTVVVNGRVAFEYVDNEYCLFNPWLVSTSDNAAKVPDTVVSRLRECTEALVDTLKLVDGVLHCQFLYDRQDIRILEYTRRPSGDLYSNVVQLATGLAHANVFVASATGVLDTALAQLSVANHARRSISRHCITVQTSGRLGRLIVSDAIRPYLLDIVQIVKFGERVNHQIAEKVAVAILAYPSDQVMTAFTQHIDKHLASEVLEHDSL